MPAWLILLAVGIISAVVALGGAGTAPAWLGTGVLVLGLLGIALDVGGTRV